MNRRKLEFMRARKERILRWLERFVTRMLTLGKQIILASTTANFVGYNFEGTPGKVDAEITELVATSVGVFACRCADEWVFSWVSHISEFKARKLLS